MCVFAHLCEGSDRQDIPWKQLIHFRRSQPLNLEQESLVFRMWPSRQRAGKQKSPVWDIMLVPILYHKLFLCLGSALSGYLSASVVIIVREGGSLCAQA